MHNAELHGGSRKHVGNGRIKARQAVYARDEQVFYAPLFEVSEYAQPARPDQNLADSLSAVYIPSTCFLPDSVRPITLYNTLVLLQSIG